MTLLEAKNKVGQVAEGVRTLEIVRNESSRLDIKMPLVESMYNIIYKEASPESIIDDLLNNPHEVDVEFKY
jgi:glycerol-3-phosphate dehydrogenase (NAD(P)+)